jgi:hypothetical protein
MLSCPFLELPDQPFGFFDMFPSGGAWYLVCDDDYPILYLGSGKILAEDLMRALPGRVLPVMLEDEF